MIYKIISDISSFFTPSVAYKHHHPRKSDARFRLYDLGSLFEGAVSEAD